MSAIPLAADRAPRPELPSPNLPSDQLAARLKAQPATLTLLQNQALGLYNQARRLPDLAPAIDALWGEFKQRAIQADRAAAATEPPVAVARVALEAAALFGDLLSLPLRRPNPLAIYNMPALAAQIADTPEARALLESRPSTKAWLAKRDASRAAQAEAHAAEIERQREQAPATFLSFVRARGINPELDDHGNIIVPPGAPLDKLLPTERRSFVEWKAELVAILQAEQAASVVVEAKRPTVLA